MTVYCVLARALAEVGATPVKLATFNVPLSAAVAARMSGAFDDETSTFSVEPAACVNALVIVNCEFGPKDVTAPLSVDRLLVTEKTPVCPNASVPEETVTVP